MVVVREVGIAGGRKCGKFGRIPVGTERCNPAGKVVQDTVPMGSYVHDAMPPSGSGVRAFDIGGRLGVL